MDRLNSEGVPRQDLKWVLTQRRMVMTARRINSCLLCRRRGVNEGGVCDVCYAGLTDEELSIVEKWVRGTGP